MRFFVSSLIFLLPLFFFFFNDTATTEIYTLSLHDALPIFCLHNAESFIAQDSGGFFGNGARPQRKIDETRACDYRRFAKSANVKMPDDFLREFPRIFATLLSEHESGICLIIAEALV